MISVSLSLTKNHVKQIDKLSNKHGFANRSEFVRSLLRFVQNKPEVLAQSNVYPFQESETATQLTPKQDKILEDKWQKFLESEKTGTTNSFTNADEFLKQAQKHERSL